MNILITGSNGYLAKNLIAKLSNYNIFSLNRNNNKKDVILDSKPDLIIHTICSYGRKGESKSEIYDSNLFTGIQLLEIIYDLGKPITFINCGTSLIKNTNLYSLSKSQLVEFGEFVSNDKLQFINMNLEHFFGPGADNNFLSFVVKECQANRNIPLTKGMQLRDFIYIDDVCDAFEKVVKFRDTMKNFETIGVGSGTSIRVRDVVEKIKKLTKSTSILGFGEISLRDNDAIDMRANITKLKSIGWKPKHTLEEGLLKIL